MTAILDARSSLLARRLTRAGLQPGESAYLAGAIALMQTNAARYAVARDALRPLKVGATATKELLIAAGMWQPEVCAAGCGRELGSKCAQYMVRQQSYCSPACVLATLGIPA